MAQPDNDAIRQCIDRMEILQLFAKYCHIVDDCTFEQLPEVFTDDAQLDYSSLGDSVQGLRTRMHGVREFIDFLTNSMRYMGPGLTHFMGNHLIDVQGDEAHIVSHNHVLNLPQGGRYTSHARRTPAGWRIDRFVFENRLYHDMAQKMGFAG
jgi:hypothetical protein